MCVCVCVRARARSYQIRILRSVALDMLTFQKNFWVLSKYYWWKKFEKDMLRWPSGNDYINLFSVICVIFLRGSILLIAENTVITFIWCISFHFKWNNKKRNWNRVTFLKTYILTKYFNEPVSSAVVGLAFIRKATGSKSNRTRSSSEALV
jgi:hypothetical protein